MNNPHMRALMFWLSLLVMGSLGWSIGCSPSPATVELRATPCVHDSQCRVDLGFRCVRLICVTQQPKPPGDGTITPPSDGGPDRNPPVERPVIPDSTPTDGTGSQCTTGSSRPCYTGPSGTANVGECRRGTQDCVNGAWHLCLAEIKPEPELCGDNKDNDCDGQTDEDCSGSCTAGESRPCSGPDAGECSPGTQTCTSDGKWGQCQGVVLPQEEICNGLDDDCDGTIDNNPKGAGEFCLDTTEKGECANGMQVCSQGKLGCRSTQGSTHEVCNKLDDDCDGLIDNNPSDVGTSCTVPGALPPCEQGTYQCTDGNRTCVPTHTPTAEVCGNNLDDDCNGMIDDGCTSTTAQCKSCGSDNDCGMHKGKQAVCYEDIPGFGKFCFLPCSSDGDCPKAFECSQVPNTSQKYCLPGYVRSSGSYRAIWYCANYQAAKQGKPCFTTNDCQPSNFSNRGAYCQITQIGQKGKCVLYCRDSSHCPTGSCKNYAGANVCLP